MLDEPPASFDEDDDDCPERGFNLLHLWERLQLKPDSDEYLILQMLSPADLGHGDPEEARSKLIARGLLIPIHPPHRYEYTAKGKHLFWNLYERFFDA